MGLRSNPSRRQLRLGRELRKLREAAGMRAVEAGAAIGLGGTHLTHIEGGRTNIPRDKLDDLLKTYGCSRKPYVRGLLGLHDATERGWWHAYRREMSNQATDLAELEAMYPRFSNFEPLHIPGLLQTPEYARALIERTHPQNPPDYTERGLAFRLRRQDRLTGSNPPAYRAILHEAAFHAWFVEPEVLRRQILHLIELSRMDHVSIQIIPFRATGLPAVGTPCILFEEEDPELNTVYLEHDVGCLFLDDEQHLARYTQTFARLAAAALPPVPSSEEQRSPLERDSLSLFNHLLYAL